MRVLFLDFDGVLHPADVWLEPDGRMRLGDRGVGHTLFEHAQLLADLLEPHEEVRVVLSTSWVLGLGFDHALAQLPVGLSRKVIGATFDPAVHGKGFGDIARGYQVQGDAAKRRLADWVALDDDARDWPEEDLERLIQTDPMLGLADHEVQKRLRAWLEPNGEASKSADALVVEGEVFEVLLGFGVAHLRTRDGTVYGVNQDTPGIENFGALRDGQRFRCEVTRKFNRVLRAQQIA